MKVKIFFLTIFFICIGNLVFGKNINVITGILPVKYFVERIAEQNAEVKCLIPPGANPTTFDLKPSDFVTIKKADVYFVIGVPFERILEKKIKDINPDLKIVRLYSSVKRIKMKSIYVNKDHRLKENNDTEFFDPHIWLSPTLVKIILMDIRDLFISIDPEHMDMYNKNYLEFKKEIDNLDKDLIDIFSNLKNRYFIVFHPSWGYFAKEYGLVQIPVEVEGKTPSPRELAELIKFAKQKNINTIFVQPQFSKKLAKLIAQRINAKVVEIDPLAENWLVNLKEVGKKISQSLKNKAY